LPGSCLAADLNGLCTKCDKGYCLVKGKCLKMVGIEHDS